MGTLTNKPLRANNVAFCCAIRPASHDPPSQPGNPVVVRATPEDGRKLPARGAEHPMFERKPRQSLWHVEKIQLLGVAACRRIGLVCGGWKTETGEGGEVQHAHVEHN